MKPPAAVSNISGRKIQSSRNQSMECCKIILSFIVLFNHFPIPGTFTFVTNVLVCYAVPIFFMIAGYFNYQAAPGQVLRRTKNIFKLLVIGTLVDLCWGCVATELAGGSTIAYLRAAIPEADEIMKWLVFHIHPYAGHLWYLNSMIACYLVFYLFTALQGEEKYRPFYFLCLVMFCLNFSFDTMTYVSGSESSAVFTRNGWYVGLPMFGLGLFIREHQERIFTALSLNSAKLLFAVAIGILLGLMQESVASLGLLHFGALIGVISLMLFLVSHPHVPVKSRWAQGLVLKFGPLSTWVYILHLAVGSVYVSFFMDPVFAALGEKAQYIGPVIIAMMSLLAAILWECAASCCRKLFHKQK